MKTIRLHRSHTAESRGRVAFLAALFLVSAALLYLPVALLEGLRIALFAEAQRFFLHVALYTSSILLFVEGIAWLERRPRSIARRRVTRRRYPSDALGGRRPVPALTPPEQAVLREFTRQGQPTLHLPFEDPVVAGLLSKGVLKIAGRFARESMRGPMFPMIIARDVQVC